jgi:hypothetical protein
MIFGFLYIKKKKSLTFCMFLKLKFFYSNCSSNLLFLCEKRKAAIPVAFAEIRHTNSPFIGSQKSSKCYFSTTYSLSDPKSSIQVSAPTLQETTIKFRDLLPSLEQVTRGKYEKRFMDQLFPQDQKKILVKELEIPASRITAQKRLDNLQFEQKVATIYALIEGNELLEAEKMMHQLYRLNKSDVTSVFNVKLFNKIIEKYLKKQYDATMTDPDCDNENELWAQEWFLSMQTDFNCKPDLHTFALFISFYLKVRNPGSAWEYVEKMNEIGFTMKELSNDISFEDDSLQLALNTMLKSRGFADDECSEQHDVELDAILESALLDTFSIKDDQKDSSAEEEYEERELDELIPTKTLGVKILKSALNFRSHEKEFDLYERQSWLETRTHTAARNQFLATQQKIPQASRKVQALPTDLISHWHDSLQKKIEYTLEKNTDPELDPILPFLKLVSPEIVSKITISELMRQPTSNQRSGIEMEFGEISALKLATGIAESIQKEHNLQQMNSKKNLKLVISFC